MIGESQIQFGKFSCFHYLRYKFQIKNYMNKLKLTMSTMLLSSLLLSCHSELDSTGDVIEKPKVEIKDGKLTPEVLEAFGRISEATMSPDKTKIVFTLAYEDIEKNASNAEIYVMDADGKNQKRLTRSVGSEHNLRWIDDGKKIAFLAKDAESKKIQLFTIDANGHNLKRISNLENGMDCFEISPDGKKIVYGAQITLPNPNQALFDGLPKTTGRLVDDLMYKHWDEWVSTIPHPFIADFDGHAIENIVDIMADEPYECPMKPFGGAETFAWTPDSKKLVYTSRKVTGMEYSFSTDSDLYLYDLETKETENLTDGMDGYDTNPCISTDGKYLAWMSMATPGYESDQNRIFILDMETKEKRNLSAEADWDYSAEGLSWTPDSKSIIFNAYYQGTEPIFKIGINDLKIETLADGVWDYVGVQAFDNDKVLALRHSMSRPNEVCIAQNGEAKDITNVNADLFAQLKLGTVKKVMIPTTDGKEMTTWVILPPDFDPNKKYPAILYCQGGPQQAVSQFWSYRWNFQIMAANGYIVIAPNRRGVPGFGTEWNAQISGDYGGQNMKDYLAAVDYMVEEPYVDAERIGAVGASYGGFSVYWLAGHHEGRFAALIAHAGIFNLEAQYLETEEMWFVNHDFGGAYWDKSNATAQRTFENSPHKFVDKWTAPILVTVGELDYRILASQGMQAFNAAKMHGLDTEMLVFPDENHWVLKPQNAILWQRVFFNFLDKHLKGEKNNKESVDTVNETQKDDVANNPA